MKSFNVIRAWKDIDYRSTLTDAQLNQMPAHPAGLVELSDEQLFSVAGARACWVTDIRGCIFECCKNSAGSSAIEC